MTSADGAPASPGQVLVELRDIEKSFGGVRAVDGVNLNLYAGEVVAVLVGDQVQHTVAQHLGVLDVQLGHRPAEPDLGQRRDAAPGPVHRMLSFRHHTRPRRSHIGIVSREFQVPCVMGCTFPDGEPANGDQVTIDNGVVLR